MTQARLTAWKVALRKDYNIVVKKVKLGIALIGERARGDTVGS
jgi:hypothetical protein